MSLAQRLQEAMNKLGMSQIQLARAAKMSQGYTSKLLTGKVKYPKEILSIAKVLGQSVEWLEHGIESRTNSLYSIPVLLPTQVISWFFAGDHRKEFEKERLDMYENGLEHCYAVKINSNTVEPYLKMGWLAIVDPIYEDYKNGDLVIFTNRGEKELMIRRYIEEGGKKYLHSCTPGIPAILFDDNIDICGKVKRARAPDIIF